MSKSYGKKKRIELIENPRYTVAIGANMSYIYNQTIKLIDEYKINLNDFILVKYTYDSEYNRVIIYKCSYDNMKKLLLLSD